MSVQVDTSFPFRFVVITKGDKDKEPSRRSFETYAEASDAAYVFVERNGGEAEVLELCKFIEDR